MEPMSSFEVTLHQEYLFSTSISTNIPKTGQQNQICSICNLKIEGGTFFEHLAIVHGSTKTNDLATPDLINSTANPVPKPEMMLNEKKQKALSLEEQLEKFNIKPCEIRLMKCEMIKIFASKYGLEKNVGSHDKVSLQRSKTLSNRNRKLHQCPYPNCGKSFSQKFSLQIHNRIHTGEKPYKCKVCFQRFSQTNGLASHERTHTGEKPFHCTVCPLRFAQSGSLSRHSRMHTLGQAHVTCPTWRKLINSSAISSHMKTVHGIKKQVLQEKATQKPKNSDRKVPKPKLEAGKGNKFLCRFPNCEKKLKSKITLQAHYITHTGEKRYECQVCFKRFRFQGGLSVHKRIHTGSKPYQCKVCFKRFSQSSTLSLHASVHTGETFRCPYCSRRCRLKCNLKIHVRNVHGKSADTAKQDFIKTGSSSSKVISKNRTTKSCFKGKGSSRASNGTVKTTQRKQSKRKKVSCDIGDQIFPRNLKNPINNSHLSKNTDKQVFACLGCPKRDTNFSNLQNHMKAAHGLKLGASFDTTLLLVKTSK